MLGHLFGARGLHRVAAYCDTRNTASASLLSRVGFSREGQQRQAWYHHGEWADIYLYGLLARDWAAAALA